MELKVFKYKTKDKEENGVFVEITDLMNLIDGLELETDIASRMWFNLKSDILISYEKLLEEQEKENKKDKEVN